MFHVFLFAFGDPLKNLCPKHNNVWKVCSPLKDYKEKLGACLDISNPWRWVFNILKQRFYHFEPESIQLIRIYIVLTISIFYYPDYVALPFKYILYVIHFKRLIAKRSTTFMIFMARIKKGSKTYYVSVADLLHWKHMECIRYILRFALRFLTLFLTQSFVFTVHYGHPNVQYFQKKLWRLKRPAPVSVYGRINPQYIP